MSTPLDEVRAVLAAYREVMSASWPSLHPAMAARAPHWPFATEDELRRELQGYLKDASAPTCPVRVFWKIGPKFLFGGCNEHFARDAGLASAAELTGLDDFSPKLPWSAQAAKYRADDQEVYDKGVAKLDILERQTSGTGSVLWVRVGKAPVRGAAAEVLGVLGMYEMLDEKQAQKIFFERSKSGKRA